MSSQSQHWTLFDNDPLSNPDYYHFTQPFSINNSHGFFAIATEHLPANNEGSSVASRTERGAELAIDAACLTFSEILDNELDFSEVFLRLFSKQWKAAVLLDAIKNTDNEGDSLATQLTDGKKISSEQQEVLALYNPSIALLYQFDKQVMLLPLGDTQIALVNRRYHCEIKKPKHLLLSDLLVDLENGIKPPFQLVNIEDYRLEMIALLSHRYTDSKTSARLNSNIIKRYRQFESKDNTEQADNSHLLIFKKKVAQTDSASTYSQIEQSNQPPKVERKKPKKSIATYVFYLFALTSATAGSYYFWQVQATETSPLALLENKNQQAPKAPINPQIAINNNQTAAIKSASARLLAKKEIEKQHILTLAKEKDKQDELKHLREQQEQTKAAALKLTLTEEVNKAYAQQQADTEAERKRLIAEEKARANQKKQELLKQQEFTRAKEEKKKQEAQLKAKKLAREKQEKAALLLIEKDLEDMNRQEKNIRTQKIAEQKKRQEEQLRIRKLKVEQERKKRAQLAKIEAEKLAEKKRLEALVRQRRMEFEKNKEKQQHQKEKAIAPPITSIEPEGRNKPQSEKQDVTKSNAAEKKRNMLAELKRQKQDQAKAKNDKLKLKQKTAVHQLVNYSKTFNRHTVQLKQKLERLKEIDQREDASSNKALIHKRKLLKGKEAVIRKRLDSLAGMYLEKLKQVCANPKIFPVSVSGSNKTERIARGVISQHMSNCSQAQSLSTSRVAATLLDKYLK